MAEKHTVYIFDDDAELLDLCSVILIKRGFNVHTSENCTDIIEKVLAVKPDLILMDNWIPDTGGVKATQILKGHEVLKYTPVVFFSANNDVSALAKEAKADAFITKPFNIADLENTVVKLIEQKRVIA